MLLLIMIVKIIGQGPYRDNAVSTRFIQRHEQAKARNAGNASFEFTIDTFRKPCRREAVDCRTFGFHAFAFKTTQTSM